MDDMQTLGAVIARTASSKEDARQRAIDVAERHDLVHEQFVAMVSEIERRTSWNLFPALENTSDIIQLIV